MRVSERARIYIYICIVHPIDITKSHVEKCQCPTKDKEAHCLLEKILRVAQKQHSPCKALSMYWWVEG